MSLAERQAIEEAGKLGDRIWPQPISATKRETLAEQIRRELGPGNFSADCAR